MKQTIYYVDALAGAGKTHSAIRHAIWLAGLGGKVAIIQPSKHLIAESYKKAIDMAAASGRYVAIHRIDSDTNPGNVTGALTKHVRFTNLQEGEILFATHSALLNNPYWHNADQWTIIVDEIISPIEDKSLKLPRNHAKLTDLLDLDSYNAHYSVLRVKEDQDALEAFAVMAENDGDDLVDAVFEDVTSALYSSNWTLFTQTPNWCSIRDGSEKKEKLLIYGLLNPKFFAAFKEVTIMGAMFHDSILAKVWHDEVDFRANKAIQNSLRYQEHANVGNLTIEYLFDRNWSKSFRNSKIRGEKVFDLALARSNESMGTSDFIFVTNRDAEEYTRAMLQAGVRVSNVCHGINEYQHINNAVFLSALNPAPSQFKMLQNLDVSADELSDAGYHQTVYQAIMRTSLRDPSITSPKHIIVPDKRAADYLARHFPGCTVVRNKHLPVIRQEDVHKGRPKTWETEEQRNNARAKRGRIEREQLALIKGAPANRISIIPSIYSPEVESFTYVDNADLIRQLEQASHTVIADKKANVLLSPAAFNADKSSDTKRGLDNIEHVNGVWLDNDGGDLTWQEFRAIFPALHMVAFSTFSGGNRYRVLIPTTSPMTIAVDHIVKQQIFDELAERGYVAPGKQTAAKPKTHGFDVGKLTPSSLFFMPCQSADRQESFFVELAGEELDPAQWTKRAPLTMFREEIIKPVVVKEMTKMEAVRNLLAAQKTTGVFDRDAKVAEAVQNYQSFPMGGGQRNNEFWKLGCRLQDMGLDLMAIENVLRSNANDNDRKAQVKSIISSLKKRAATR